MFNLIKTKYTILITVFIILVVSIPVAYLLSQMKSNFQERSEVLMESVFDLLSYRIEHEMEEGQTKVVQDIVDELGRESTVEKVRIIAPDGTVLYSNLRDEDSLHVNRFLPEKTFRNDIDKREMYFSLEGESYTLFEPIYNSEECMHCHGSNPVIAYLNIESKATQPEVHFYTGIIHTIMLGIVVVFILIVGIRIIYSRLIEKPMNSLLGAIHTVEQGDLSVRIPVVNNDEYSILSNHFNDMLDNIVESKEKIDELNYQKLQRADRLVTLGELTAGVAHEINNYSAIIMARADFLKIAAETDGHLHKYYDDLKVIVDQLDQLSKITKEVLKYSKKPSEDYTQLNLTDVIEGSIKLLTPITRKKNTPVYKRYKINDQFWIKGNAVQLGQVFNNLLGNSIDAFSEKGDNRIVVEIKETDYDIIVTIEDNGEGIEKSAIDQIFLPFFTTKSSERGTGLGLYIVNKICSRHNITLKCESEKGVGTKFILIFNKYGINK